MNDILREYVDLIAVGIVNDVIIFSDSFVEHVPHVRSILEVLRQHRLCAKVEKCEFDGEQMTFVGYVVSKDGIGMDPAKMLAILDWPIPTSVYEVHSSLGFANSCRRFINSYSSLASPHTSLTRKVVIFTWSVEAEATFRALQ